MILSIVQSQKIFTIHHCPFTIETIHKKAPAKYIAGAFNMLHKDYSSIFTFPLFFAITSSAILFGAGE